MKKLLYVVLCLASSFAAYYLFSTQIGSIQFECKPFNCEDARNHLDARAELVRYLGLSNLSEDVREDRDALELALARRQFACIGLSLLGIFYFIAFFLSFRKAIPARVQGESRSYRDDIGVGDVLQGMSVVDSKPEEEDNA